MTGDPTRDAEHTERDFATADVPWTDDDYAAAKHAETCLDCGIFQCEECADYIAHDVCCCGRRRDNAPFDDGDEEEEQEET